MTILDTDIKLLESERMSDAADGGGRMTSTEIVSGELSNIFPKVSRTDAVYGRVNLRKVYAAVRSATLDMYGGAHAILTDSPDDEKIGAVLFSTGSAFDTRAAARDRIESYVVAGGLSRMRLYGNQIVGSKAIVVYQRVEEPLPEAGNVLCLSVEASGYTAVQQYVRITEFDNETRTFTDSTGDFSRRVLTLKLSAPLVQTFVGAEPSRFAVDQAPTKVRDTIVADASRYSGIAPVSGALAQGALELQVGSIHAPLVPAATREVPVSLVETGLATSLSGCALTDWGKSSNFDWFARKQEMEFLGVTTAGTLKTTTFTTHRGIVPGSLTFALLSEGGTYGTPDLIDDGHGNIVYQNDGNISFFSAIVDYGSGAIVVTTSHIGELGAYARYLPAVETSRSAHSKAIGISLATRGTVYAETLLPLPAKGSVVIDYRALGKWYRLRDDGAGALVSDSLAVGTGSIDYNTGALVVTLGALPDIDSAVLPAWGSPTHAVIRAGATADAGATVRHVLQLDDFPLESNSVSVGYVVNGVTRTLTDNSGGVLSGTGASGSVDYAKGRIDIEYSDRLPDPGSAVHVVYTKLVPQGVTPIVRSYQVACDGGRLFDLADDPNFAAIQPGSLRGTMVFDSSAGELLLEVKDNGSGSVQVAAAYNNGQVGVAAGQVVGTLNYTTGVIAATATLTIQYMQWRPLYGFFVGQNPGTWEQTAGSATARIGAVGSFVYQTTAGTSTANLTADFDVDGAAGVAPLVDLCRSSSQTVVPGSVLFTLAGRYYWDESGTLYTRANGRDTTKIEAGTIDYGTGLCALALWTANTALDLMVNACLTAYGQFTAVDVDFRTSGSPLRPASFYVQVTAQDGELLSATSDQNGTVSGTEVVGTIDQTMGVAHLDFGAMVPAAGNEAAWWFDADNVVDGMIWRPREVLPGTLRYNCVVQTALPLDAALLGIDPVRLPPDGRVPIIRAGDIVVLHHTDDTTLTNPVTNGQSYSLGRADLAVVSLADSAGTAIPADKWTANLTAGTVTIAADANLTAYTQPLVATHRIEQMNLCADSQITGDVTLAFPLARAFPSGSLLSSALPFGDLYAHVSNVFDQATWDGVWADALRGSQASAQFDDINFPIEVLNDGAVTERWRISFTGTTAFAVIGENLGQIATGTTAGDVQVTNPLTGKAYFTLRAAGWGSGWGTGNQLRFNTVGANAPIWIARTILGGAGLGGDSLTLEVRGDTD